MRQTLGEIEKKIAKLEGRYIYGEIENELYDKYIVKLKKERKGISQKLEEINFQLSNTE
jgi:hypothetical protein